MHKSSNQRLITNIGKDEERRDENVNSMTARAGQDEVPEWLKRDGLVAGLLPIIDIWVWSP
ncbi:hypothetical protein SCP_0306380 [Sparassis crispa]|uniref:Uncharacterized protein n=1 Tax=Sparassis crispa TaxID=139825 RepID=A0A401GFF2_9APHY|nr:hypothetical protein SCP_0306380 [Sparassis crispa]GBE80916.1 hypothetical protein SCP_0306380 [Sparassis crispa]